MKGYLRQISLDIRRKILSHIFKSSLSWKSSSITSIGSSFSSPSQNCISFSWRDFLQSIKGMQQIFYRSYVFPPHCLCHFMFPHTLSRHRVSLCHCDNVICHHLPLWCSVFSSNHRSLSLRFVFVLSPFCQQVMSSNNVLNLSLFLDINVWHRLLLRRLVIMSCHHVLSSVLFIAICPWA